MSFSLSSIASAAGIPGASYLPAVFLGDLPLGDFAVPEKIRAGAQQQFTVHKLPGGARVFDSMGPDPDPIEFNGIFLGPLAFVQLAQLQAMQTAAQPIALSWGVYYFTVLIQRVQPEIGFNRVDWSVSLLVVPPPPPDNPDDDDADVGDGETPDAPATKQTQGQTAVQKARTSGGGLPTPPIPPSQPPAAAVPFTGSGVHDR